MNCDHCGRTFDKKESFEINVIETKHGIEIGVEDNEANKLWCVCPGCKDELEK